MDSSAYTDREPSDEYSQLSKSIAADLQKAGQLIRQLQSASNSPNESAASIMRRFKEVETLVKDVAERMKRLRNTVPPIGRQERAKMERQRLQDNLLEILTQLKDTDKQITGEMKKRNEAEKQKLGSMQNRNSDLLDVNSSPGVGTGDPTAFFGSSETQSATMVDPLHQVQLQQQQVEYEQTLEQIRERDSAMQELEQGVTQVNEIFKDMAQLIHDQGDVIDNIETQIDKAESSARSGTQHLGTAVKHQKRGTRTKLIIFGVLGAIAFFIILIVVLKLKD
ncbi:syntaxin-7-like [Symsagittifera roscoffensis]|uniref:syntaxin-7-like n=1 Tax=Symsagittifera roscoffensis TaxID=84072 RepID=UPI00307C569C